MKKRKARIAIIALLTAPLLLTGCNKSSGKKKSNDQTTVNPPTHFLK